MPLTDNQAESIKQQLFIQISKLPEQQQATAKNYIQSLNNKQLEQFLVQNRILGGENRNSAEKKPGSDVKCIFCAIAAKQIQSFAIYEDKDYLAVLEIKPFANGHTILIPKKHIKQAKNLPSRAFAIANKIGRHLAKKLKAETFQINTTAEIGHAILNIIPVYKGEELAYERRQAKQQELQELAIKIGEVVKRKKEAAKPQPARFSKEKLKAALIKLPRRIP